MKFVKISQSEIGNIRSLYEGVMANASHGLFYREGMLTGSEIIKLARDEDSDLLQTATKLLVARGWAESIRFEDKKVIVSGSIEVGKADEPTCHRLRGVFKRLYEAVEHKKVVCEELQCQSNGAESCIFAVNVEEGSDE
jgi:predicted hydrocarbon binding protein